VRLFWKAALAGVLVIILYTTFLWLTLPDISDPKEFFASQSTAITDRNGVELYRLFSEEDRTFIPGNTIPVYMKQAAIAIEDERFHERGCLDIRALARVALFLGRAGGGSTITRQLARNALHLQKENRYKRKLKELFLGCQLERQYSKEELLELYLNWIPFGQNAYGVEQASKVYFNTSASELTLAQSAVLAALPQRPTYFSPYGRHVYTKASADVNEKVHTGKIVKVSEIPDDEILIGLLGAPVGSGASILYVGGRTDQVLKNMQNQGYITETERLQALTELEDILFEPSRETIRAPHFVLWVREQFDDLFGAAEEGILEQGGLTIETTLDWPLQEAAEEAVERYKEDIFDRFGAWNIALAAIHPQTKEVLAYIGNTDYEDQEHGGKIDMVRAPRQPGSSFKPFVYAAAFQQGYTPATPIYDVLTEIGDDEPQNFDGKFFGLLTMRKALGASRNIPAAKTFFLAGGEERILALASALGAKTPRERKQELKTEREDGFDYGWPLALGAAETPLIEMVHGYSTFASEGKFKPLISIRRVTDKNGNILYEAEEKEGDPVLDDRIAYQITSVLSDESARPEEYWRTQLTVPGYQTAAKTGTSNKCMEWREIEEDNKKICLLRKPDNAWLVGYTPSLVGGVWVGNADSSAMYEKAGGLNTASPVWRDFMYRAHRLLDAKKTSFDVPDGIIQPQISELSGQFPTPCTPVEYRKADVFLEEKPPTKQDPVCKNLIVDRLTNLLSSDSCPSSARVSGSFLAVQSLLPERWPKWEEGVQKWADEQMELWHATEDHSGSIIPLPRAPTEQCDPSLTPGRMEKPTVTILKPTNGGTASFPSFKPKIDYSVGSEIREVIYLIDGRRVRSAQIPPYTPMLRVPRSISSAGSHTLAVQLVDKYYNTATARVSFRFQEDAGGPQVRFLQPAGDIIVNKGEEITLRAEAIDNEGGIKYVQFFLDETLLTTKPKDPYKLKYKIDLDPGTYTLRTEARDLAGNTAVDEIVLTVEEVIGE